MVKMERIVKRYYEELENGKIMGRKCPACGAVQFPPRIACTVCGNMEQKWVEVSGKAVLTDITIPSRMTGPSLAANFGTFVMGCFDMEEGPELNGILKDVTPEEGEALKAKLPLPVEAEICQLPTMKTVAFHLIKEP